MRSEWTAPAVLSLGWFLLVAAHPGAARSEEGMWLPDHVPAARIQAAYGFAPDSAWMEERRRACVLLESASGAFVSPRGLILTNHHVGIDQIERLSTPERNLLRDGFLARRLEDELPCPGMEVEVLDCIADVTAEVLAASSPDTNPDSAREGRRRVMSRLEQEAAAATGLHAKVVRLYHGARYHLYLYKTYEDVRLVFAPEERIANFGGDADNFEYPRHAFDLCFFRVYEDGRPLRGGEWLRWSARGAGEGELVMALGHPFRTSRQLTGEQFRLARDILIPGRLQTAWRREVRLLSFSERSPENARAALGDLLGVQNHRKSEAGVLAGMHDPAVLASAVARDESLRAWVERDPARRERWGRGWKQVAEAQEAQRALFPRWRFFGRLERAIPSELFRRALTLVEMARELPKPNEERAREYRDTEIEAVRRRLLTPRPLVEDLEIEGLESGLSLMAELFGAEDSIVVAALDGLSPRERARLLVGRSALRDPDVVRRLVTGGPRAIEASVASGIDPLLGLATLLDRAASRLRREHERRVEGPEEEGGALLAEAGLARDGDLAAPDATGTLRLSYGTIRGYEEGGTPIPAFTTLGGLFARSEENEGRPPFDPPRRWTDAAPRLDPDLPLNFVSTLDTVGGSSGSPVVNARGELVGLVFDGNIESLVWDYAWEDVRARCIALDSRAILEGLRIVYGADALADELAR
jgi:hypothetical protein